MDSWQPELLYPAEASSRARLAELRAARDVQVFDTLQAQVADLAQTRHPGPPLQGEVQAQAIAAVCGGDLERYGAWVYYAWSRRLVRLLAPQDFFELRTDRNRLKIVRDEQALLQRKRIAVLGLSVGQAAALTLTLEGIGGRFRLADFDTLSLSNLNRLRAGVHELGVNKAVITARAMFELNPYLDIEILPQGVTDANLATFLDGIDLLVEECDSIVIKFQVREEARRRRIPVIMDTSERGMLDVERFDLQPERPLFHGLLPGVTAADVAELPRPAQLPLVLGIVGVDGMSGAMAASMCELGHSISTWPQLGSSVTLGGALVADTARRVLLDQFRASGRYFVDLAELITPATAADTTPVDLAVRAAPEATQPRRELAALRAPARGRGAAPSAEEIRFLVAHASLAPSSGNRQPWQFGWNGTRLTCALSSQALAASGDAHDNLIALGAAVENIVLSATSLGLAANVSELKAAADARPAVAITFARGDLEPSPLATAIADRVTNRRLAPPQALAPSDVQAMQAALHHPAGVLALRTADDARLALGTWLGEVERLRHLEPRLHAELMADLRFTPHAATATRDGLDVATLEASPTDVAIMRILGNPEAMARLAQVDGGHALKRGAAMAMAQCSAAVLVGVRGGGDHGAFDAGRQLQRVWLAATLCGLAVQPWGALPSLLARLDRGAPMSPRASELMTRLSPAWRGFWDLGAAAPFCGVMLRLAHAPPPSAISLRRDVPTI
ncbi:MAG: Rv1355c family protein [Myxococcales bacterium]|nr:Rv1355c family protein [Myxococcales bacterium]